MFKEKTIGLAAIIAMASLTLAAKVAMAEPPFAAGEVVVAGTPDEFPGLEVKKYLPLSNLTVLAVESGREWGVVQSLRARGKQAGLNHIAHATMVPSDPHYGYQWHFAAIQAEEAWDITAGEGVDVAVVDTGFNPGGTDGLGCVRPGYNFVKDNDNPLDRNGHGTHVSGTIAQATNNGVGVAGLAHGACIIPVKVLNDKGSGTSADIAEGIRWAVDHGAQVINMSLGFDVVPGDVYDTDPYMDPAMEYAYAAGVTVVCAAGNDAYLERVGYPANFWTTIAVGATDFLSELSYYSNAGTDLDVVAPGGDTRYDLNGDGYIDGVLQETYNTGTFGYYFFQGTSMASPHVAAVVALYLSLNLGATPDEVKSALASTALDLGDEGWDPTFGHGLVQAFDLLLGSAPLSCTIDADCADSDLCDGDETCVEGECQPGIPIDCDDGDLCNGVETCVAGECQPGSPVSCDDGNPCNGGESCDPLQGCLPGVPLTCEPSDICHAGVCDPMTGCGEVAIDCDDGDACTADSCDLVNGCTHTAIPDCGACLGNKVPCASNDECCSGVCKGTCRGN